MSKETKFIEAKRIDIDDQFYEVDEKLFDLRYAIVDNNELIVRAVVVKDKQTSQQIFDRFPNWSRFKIIPKSS